MYRSGEDRAGKGLQCDSLCLLEGLQIGRIMTKEGLQPSRRRSAENYRRLTEGLQKL
jgi:hypothetical protein